MATPTEERESAYMPRGNCKHTGFPEFDNLTGYVVDRYRVDWTGKDGTRYRKLVTVINLGRPDRGMPGDPDGQLRAERFEDKRTDAAREARAVNVANGEARRAERRDCIAEYLRKYGPCGCFEIASDLGYARTTAQRVLLEYRGTAFEIVARQPPLAGGKPTPIWGLVGVHDKGAV